MNHGQPPRLQHPRPAGRPTAFTLVELIMVVIIIGIVAGMAVPRFANALVNQRLTAATRRLTTDLQLAQRRARLTGQSVTVAFDADTHSYQLVGLSDIDHAGEDYEVRLWAEPYGVLIGAVDAGGDNELIFNGYGEPDSALTITLQAGATARELTAAAGSAEVTITETNAFPAVLPPQASEAAQAAVAEKAGK